MLRSLKKAWTWIFPSIQTYTATFKSIRVKILDDRIKWNSFLKKIKIFNYFERIKKEIVGNDYKNKEDT